MNSEMENWSLRDSKASGKKTFFVNEKVDLRTEKWNFEKLMRNGKIVINFASLSARPLRQTAQNINPGQQLEFHTLGTLLHLFRESGSGSRERSCRGCLSFKFSSRFSRYDA